MKIERYIVEIEMPDGDIVSPGWLEDLVQADLDVEDEGRARVSVRAVKDLALTPEDIKLITKIHYEIVFKDTTGIKVGDVAEEVLKRFNEQRKK